MKEDALMTARRYLSLSLQRIGSVGQKKIAEQLELSEATLSRFVANDLERACQVLSMAGLQVCPKDVVVVSRDDIQALERMAFKYLQARIEADSGGY